MKGAMMEDIDRDAGEPFIEQLLVIALVLILGLAAGISLGVWMSSDWLMQMLGGA